MEQLTFDVITGAAGEQRWRDRRDFFVPHSRRFDPSRCEVVALPEAEAKAFVLRHHYSRSFPAARFRAGLMVKPAFGTDYLGGVAVFSVPMQNAAIPKYLGTDPLAGVELGRLVLLDDPLLGFNAESWFVARAFKLMRSRLARIKGVISYSDPMARHDANGAVIKPGHAGQIYRALNGKYHGRSSARTLILSTDGRVVSERALSKLRTGDTGAEYAYRQLLDMGAPARALMEDARKYVDRALVEGGFRRLKHPGNHVFSWLF